MALADKKQALGGGGTKEKLGKTPPPKEPKPSGFGGKPFIRREEFRGWLKGGEAWEVSKMPQTERVGLEKKLFDPGRFGQLIDPKEVQKVYKEIKDFPIRSKEKYEIKSERDRANILKLLEKKFLGK